MIQDRHYIIGSHILVVDDSPTNLNLLTQMLSEQGIHCSTTILKGYRVESGALNQHPRHVPIDIRNVCSQQRRAYPLSSQDPFIF